MSDSNNDVEYLWCLHCNRAYKQGEYRLKSSQWTQEDIDYFRRYKLLEEDVLKMMGEPIEMCFYCDCDGDVIGDAIPWRVIREAHPDYPKVPEMWHEYLG